MVFGHDVTVCARDAWRVPGRLSAGLSRRPASRVSSSRLYAANGEESAIEHEARELAVFSLYSLLNS